MNLRIIPRLDIKGDNLVKGVHFEGLRVLGKPEDYAEQYYQDGADELIFMDIVASLFQRNSLHDIIQKTAKRIFIPLTVGGGLRSIEDIHAVLRIGADKVALNTAAIQNPNLIREAAIRFGSSTIVVSLEVVRRPDGTFECFTDNGRTSTGLNALTWARHAVELGAGELLITSVDKEGTGKGFEIDLFKQIAQCVSVPVVAGGGAGKSTDILNVVGNSNVDAVCISSILHYHYLKKFKHDFEKFTQGNTDFLVSGAGNKSIEDLSLIELKRILRQNGIVSRLCE